MPTTFYGKWSLQVIGNVGEFAQRVRIQGSLNADGNLNAALGAQIAEIDGAAWIVRLERSGDGGATWQENLVQRIPTVTPQNGLTFTLYGDDSVVPAQDGDVTVQFVYFDQQINPRPRDSASRCHRVRSGRRARYRCANAAAARRVSVRRARSRAGAASVVVL